jgi:hypothetical protein
MTSARRLVLLLALLGAAACGPSSAEVRAARRSVYQTEFPTVWNAVVATVKSQYPRLVIEDPARGQVLTDWHLIERVDLDDSKMANTTPMQGNQPGQIRPGEQAALPNIGGLFFRVAVTVKPGGPPWRIEVDGEAALYRPGMALITPYAHGAADEPSWVGPRLDKVRVGIYRQLKPHARIVVEEAKAPKKRDESAWQNLPDDAVPVVSGVHAAAAQKDTGALRPFMSDEFVWSLAGQPGADAAVVTWDADPSLLSKLRDALAAGCDLRAEKTKIVCPVTGDQPGVWRAEFVKGPGGDGWRFTAFYLNE